MDCTHNYIWKSLDRDTYVAKVGVCDKCGRMEVKYKEVGKQEPKAEVSVWDKKDLRISRMSVLKTATDIVLAKDAIRAESNPNIEDEAIEVARKLEKYIYEEGI